MEKLLGFLVAVVIMAFYIGVVNLVLMFFSFSLFQSNFSAYALSFVGALPIVFFAQYRARRYILARTRWRGIRFGLEAGAWGYAWRAAVWWLVAILSLGILWPVKVFKLEKYRTDRTFYGTARFHQGGRWTLLFPAMKHLYYAAGLSAVAGAMLYLFENPLWLLVFFVSVPWAVYGVAYWMATSFRLLTEAKELDGVGFVASPRPGRILGIYVGGYSLASIASSAAVTAALMVLGLLLVGVGQQTFDIFENGGFGGVPAAALIALGLASYFGIFLLWGVFRHVFVTMPLAEHYAETMRITGAHHLARIRQRARDEFAEAEGFADALDVGAAL